MDNLNTLKLNTAKLNLNKSGMSLVELICTVAILALVLYPIYEFLRQGALSWETGENKTEVIQNARIGLDKMCDEIKHGREFYTITANQIRFWYQDTNENKIADSNEILSYTWSGIFGADLLRKFDSESAGMPLANYVDLLDLKYYDKHSGETTSPGNVFFITATLRIKKIGKASDYTSTMRKAVHLRNM
ncbi:MAG: prepilin-type N-terminal cleavage/methylation domain-containing protein [Candidatus Omnitrophota bacterium]